MQYILIFFFLFPKQLPDPLLHPTTHLLKTLYLSVSLKKNKQNLKKKKTKSIQSEGKTWNPFCVAQLFLIMGSVLECGCYTQCLSYFFIAMMEYHDQQQLRELWWLFLTVNVTTSKTD